MSEYEDIKKNFFKKCTATSLMELLMSRTKKDLEELRRALQISHASNLKKKELALVLYDIIPDVFECGLYSIDKNAYGTLKKAIDFKGKLPDSELLLSRGISLFYLCFLFPVQRPEGRFYVMPDELFEIFLVIDGVDLQETAARNSEIVELAHGLLDVYGVLDSDYLHEKICRYMRRHVELVEFLLVMEYAESMYDLITRNPYFFHSVFCENPVEVYFAGEERGVEYRRYTKKNILLHANPDYFEATSEANRFKYSLIKHLGLSREDSESVVSYIAFLMKRDESTQEIIDFLHMETGDFPEGFLEVLADNLMDLNNNTPKWILRGHTPNEIGNIMGTDSEIVPQGVDPYFEDEDESETTIKPERPKLTLIKTGRNEPCSCGSGKKHKDCCGRN